MIIPEGWRPAKHRKAKPNMAESKSSGSKEVWKRYKDSPYQVSSKGRVRRLQENGEYSYRKPRDDDRKHLRMNLTWNGKREEPPLHQMVMDVFGPPKPKGENIVILHKDNDGTNNAVSNLKWGTRSQNVQQAHDDGLI